MGKAPRDSPPIELSVTIDDEALTLEIADRGTGIQESSIRRAFSYMATSSTAVWGNQNNRPSSSIARRRGTANPPKVLLAGFGVGLPLSRVYARCMSGDLHLIPREGGGTIAKVKLPQMR